MFTLQSWKSGVSDCDGKKEVGLEIFVKYSPDWKDRG